MEVTNLTSWKEMSGGAEHTYKFLTKARAPLTPLVFAVYAPNPTAPILKTKKLAIFQRIIQFSIESQKWDATPPRKSKNNIDLGSAHWTKMRSRVPY